MKTMEKNDLKKYLTQMKNKNKSYIPKQVIMQQVSIEKIGNFFGFFDTITIWKSCSKMCILHKCEVDKVIILKDCSIYPSCPDVRMSKFC